MNYKEYTVRVYKDRTKWFNKNGQLHRGDGPAIEYNNGYKEWYQDGQRHREDGPAIEWADGSKEWWVNGKRHREEEFNQRTQSCEGKIVEIEGKKYKLVGV